MIQFDKNISDIEFCKAMLPQVSRTFAPTIKMLPKTLFVPVAVAYLLCRIADTVEDEPSISKTQKEHLLELYIKIFQGKEPEAYSLFVEQTKVISQHSPDVFLMHNFDRVYNVLNSFESEVKRLIGVWVIEMALGMKKYAQSMKKSKFRFLKSMKELDEYMYYVAGTVGQLLTSLFAHFSQKITPNIKQKLESFAESFGKGLQMVNIIRDMTTDLRRGQSYIPDEILSKYDLTRQSIFETSNREQAQRMFNELIETAVRHMDKAMSYIVIIPKEETRIRLFCLLPVFWAMRTLQKIQENTLQLLNNDKIKISRWIIKSEFYKAIFFTFSNRLTLRHYLTMRKDFAFEMVPISQYE
jgi:farnesyl-diphosphate farnesyltransferase